MKLISRFNNPLRLTAGLTLLEVIVAVSALTIVFGGVMTAAIEVERAFVQNQILSQVNLRAQVAMERVVALSSQAVTSDPLFSPLEPSTGIDSRALCFRLIQDTDSSTGDPIYDDLLHVYVCGPSNGLAPCRGLVVGRGASLTSIHAAGAGKDGFLGTVDDNTSLTEPDGVALVELLIPSNFAPRRGEMFTINIDPAPIGRLITFTLRLNFPGRDGDFLLPDDLVLAERVALRQ